MKYEETQLRYFNARAEYLERELARAIAINNIYDIDRCLRDIRRCKGDILRSQHQYHLRLERAAGYDRYAEKLAITKAMTAMRNLGAERHVTVRSREGMLRMLQKAYGKSTRVRWSWPASACARSHRTRPLFA